MRGFKLAHFLLQLQDRRLTGRVRSKVTAHLLVLQLSVLFLSSFQFFLKISHFRRMFLLSSGHLLSHSFDLLLQLNNLSSVFILDLHHTAVLGVF